MSTTADAGRAIAGCRPAAGTPVSIAADAIESTADDYLRGLKAELDAEGYVPSEVVVDAAFDADCSITTQAEADRVRDVLHAADFLGAGTVRLEVEGVADAAKVRPAISALRERAEREGLTLAVDGLD
ncbi:MAG: hypothetical protein U5J98_11070 [Halobacteriales archaeon]|nr:hypothetical protein [Halobacteriales archaeon]